MSWADGGTLPVDRHVRSLERLLAIAATALEPALDEAADALHEALAAEKIDVFLHEPATDTLVALGVSSTPLGDRQRAIGIDRLPLANGGRVVEVFRTGHAYCDGYVEADAEVHLHYGAAARRVGLVARRAELVEELTRAAPARRRRMAAEGLVTALAHDLRNYLTPLQGGLALLRWRSRM